MGELDIRPLLRVLREEADPDPMAERLVEMYQGVGAVARPRACPMTARSCP